MRHLLFAFLIVLMPLRGWAGDTMAVHMLGQKQTAVAENATVLIASDTIPVWASASNATHFMAGMPSDCPGHQAVVVAPADVNDAAPGFSDPISGECKTCSACQICHTVAVELSPPVIAMLRPAQPTPIGVVASPFVSAVLAPGLKPPIS